MGNKEKHLSMLENIQLKDPEKKSKSVKGL